MAEEETKKNITYLGAETEFNGVLQFTDNLIITGKFSGKIVAPGGNLELAKNSFCDVERIEVSSAIISGNVKGDLVASERVEICSGSVVESDITTARIRIANNVDFNGQITMLDKEPDADLFTLASPEYKKALLVHSNVDN